jgi:translation initiation factor IF-2
VSSAVGEISETDVNFAKTAGAILIGFNVGMSAQVRQQANREQVKVRLYKIIYELLDDIRDVLGQMLPPEVIDTVVAELDILGVFKLTKGSVVCGGQVTTGKVTPKLDLRVTRKKEVLGTGTLASLEKDKQETKEVIEGEQCGMRVTTNVVIEVGDHLEFYTTEMRARTL